MKNSTIKLLSPHPICFIIYPFFAISVKISSLLLENSFWYALTARKLLVSPISDPARDDIAALGRKFGRVRISAWYALAGLKGPWRSSDSFCALIEFLTIIIEFYGAKIKIEGFDGELMFDEKSQGTASQQSDKVSYQRIKIQWTQPIIIDGTVIESRQQSAVYGCFFFAEIQFSTLFWSPSSCWWNSLWYALCHPILPILVCLHTSFYPGSYGIAHGVFCYWCSDKPRRSALLFVVAVSVCGVVFRFHCSLSDPGYTR